MDILSALEAAPKPGERQCKLAKFLESIPPDEPGRDELVARVEQPEIWPSTRMSLVFATLGFPVSPETLQDHRGKRCVCYR